MFSNSNGNKGKEREKEKEGISIFSRRGPNRRQRRRSVFRTRNPLHRSKNSEKEKEIKKNMKVKRVKTKERIIRKRSRKELEAGDKEVLAKNQFQKTTGM